MQRVHGMLEGMMEAMEIYNSHSEIDTDKMIKVMEYVEEMLHESLEEMKYVFDLIDPQYY